MLPPSLVTSLLLLSFAVTPFCFGDEAPCPAECKCHVKSLDCSYRGLNVVPNSLPSHVERIDFRGNQLTVLRRGDFAGLERLKILLLSDNNISRIEGGTFDDAPGLQRIRLNRNKLSELDDGIFAKLGNLDRLDLSENHLTSIGPQVLQGLEGLENLQLDNNRLQCVSSAVISKMSSLQILTLNSNELKLIPEGLLNSKRLRILRINENPLHCSCSMRWLVDWLHNHVGLGPVPKCQSPQEMHGIFLTQTNNFWSKCSTNPHLHSLDQSAFAACQEPVQCPEGCSCRGNVVSCQGHLIDRIPIESLPAEMVELRINRGRISEIPNFAFSKFKMLKSLEISDSLLKQISPTAFSGLVNLRSLTLFGNKMEDLPENVFSELTSLETLYLNNNQLRCLRKPLFASQTKLRILSLFDNKLVSIANGTFDSLHNLIILHLGQNPFICDCNLKWLFDFLQSRPALEKTNVRCESPARSRRKRVLTAGSDTFECRTRSEYLRTAGAGECRIEPACPSACRCDELVANCSGVGLTDAQVLPPFFEIPSYAQVIDLSSNNLMTFPGHLLKKTQIRMLLLQSNYLTAIDKQTFNVDFPNQLVELDLANNEIASIEPGSFDSFHQLAKLNLDSNKLPCISNQTFTTPISRSLTSLSLVNNQIKCMQPLGPLSLGSRPIVLSELKFADNPLSCDCNLKEFVGWLQSIPSLKLGNFSGFCQTPKLLSNFDVVLLQPSQLVCPHDELMASVSCRGLGASVKIPPKEPCCPANLVKPKSLRHIFKVSEVMCDAPSKCPSQCTCVSQVVRCSGKSLDKIPENLPSDTTHLYLDKNNISTLNLSALLYLKELKRIDLSYNQISYLPASGLLKMKTLDRMKIDSLILNFNKIQCVNEESLSGLDSLRLLLLHGNNISSLPVGLFNPTPRLQLMGIGQNPLYCDCNLKWLSEVVKKSFIESGIAMCTGPKRLAGRLLLTAESANFLCSKDDKVPDDIASKCNPCLGVTCSGMGKCQTGSNGFPDYTCKCEPGYQGKNCEVKIDACYAKPCLNGGSCSIIDEFGKFTCSCLPGFDGDRCQTNIDDCENSQCKNGATCVDQVQSYKCQCIPGFDGKYCEQKIEFCTIQANPCQNGATCIDDFTDYRCLCQGGFAGRNCSDKVTDCREKQCANGGECSLTDSITSRFVCRCASGFRGDFCERSTKQGVDLYRVGEVSTDTKACQPKQCKNKGRCFEKPGTPLGFHCECRFGFSGSRCERVHVVGFSRRRGSFIRLPLPTIFPSLNITMVISTRQNKGVLLFAGDDEQFFSVEIFEGYAKASFFIGNHQMSTGFSYRQVADSLNHTLEVKVAGQSMTLRVDNGLLHTVRNDGPNEQLIMAANASLYVGGLPRERSLKERRSYRIRDSSSFYGCVLKMYMNGELVNFGSSKLVLERHAVKPGCGYSKKRAKSIYYGRSANRASSLASSLVPSLLMSDSRQQSCNRFPGAKLTGPPCSGKGQCVIARNGSTFVCNCKTGYSGKNCENAPTCVAQDQSKYFFDDNGCKSRKPIRQRLCEGSCGKACCKPTKIKTRRIRLHCPDGRSYTKQVPVVKKCGCVRCNAQTKRLRRVSFWEH